MIRKILISGSSLHFSFVPMVVFLLFCCGYQKPVRISLSSFIFGPVNSRRLGRSLGINIMPQKICNLDCLYCEVGPTIKPSWDRDFFTSWLDIKDEFLEKIQAIEFDVISITGFGEPTLNLHLPDIAAQIKKHSNKPLVLLTNSLLLSDAQLRSELLDFSIICPSLDSALLDSFKRLDRPVSFIQPEVIIEGLKKLRQEFDGQINLEILFIKNINDSNQDIKALNKAIDKIKPNRVELSTLSRKPLTAIREKFPQPIEALSYDKLNQIAKKIKTEIPLLILKKPEDPDDLINVGSFYKKKAL